MKKLSQYKIDIYGLSNATHHLQFQFDDAFFSLFEKSLIKKGKGICEVEVVKSSSMIELNLTIKGAIALICDRSLEVYDHKIETRHSLIYKYGDEEKELSENVFVIPKHTQELYIGSFLYEFISLEIPMKKLHPRFQNENDSDELIYSSTVENPEETTIDPRWEILKKLK